MGRSLRLRAAFPLLVLGGAGAGLAAYLRTGPAASGHTLLPLWVLALGIGVIALGGAAVLLLAAAPAPTAPLPSEPDVVIVPRTEWERLVSRVRTLAAAESRPTGEPPAPPSWPTSPAAPSPPPPGPEPPSTGSGGSTAVPSTAAAPAGSPPRSRPMIEGPSCATCGRTVPARAAWRGCVVCRRPLCTDCLTASVRERGASYCAACAATA